jgi:MoxR-like ATPase
MEETNNIETNEQLPTDSNIDTASETDIETAQPAFTQRLPLEHISNAVDGLESEMSKVLVGQKDMLQLLLAGLMTGGHVLIEGVPGVAKTLTAKLLAHCLQVDFTRIQFTPDLMPSDVVGTSIFNPKTSSFEFKQGPIFGNLVLIDEINRSPAKTQSALFEVMEEKQVTVDGYSKSCGA